MTDFKSFSIEFLIVCLPFFLGCIQQREALSPERGNAGNRVNPGWYGWLGDFHDVRGYYPPSCDRAYFARHNINWFMLGHQWVVPFLESATYQVKEAILENCKQTRIWYEAYWWGDHSVWKGTGGARGFGMNHIPQKVLEILEREGIQPGGDNLAGKDWTAAATHPEVLASIKKTIQWQLDTIFKHCGPDALYGVILSEEEPVHGANEVLGEKGARNYGEHREQILPQLVKVHNQLYDFIKRRYPQLKVSPGFYPDWVIPGTLKMDAAVMDLYPPPGKEEEFIEKWNRAYGALPKDEQYILLWGYGDGDRKMECERFDKISAGFLKRGYRNLGVFRAELALKDRVHRLFDVDATGNYAPYRIDKHRANIKALWEETAATGRELEELLGECMGPLPAVPHGALASRENLRNWAAQIYKFRESVLDMAYSHVQEMKTWRSLAYLISLLKAEGLVPEDAPAGAKLPSSQLNQWEQLSKEYETLPDYFSATLPVEKDFTGHARVLGGRLLHASSSPEKQYPEEILGEVKRHLSRLADFLNRAEIIRAEQEFHELYRFLFAHKAEKSYQLRIVFENTYEFPLNLAITLTAEYGNGLREEIYSGFPCETADRHEELVLCLPCRPISLELRTSSWSGALTISQWVLFNSRGQIQPKAVKDVDHIDHIVDWFENRSRTFLLHPWSSRAGARIVY